MYIICTAVEDVVRDPCNPSPCGNNALCKERNGAGSCTCLPEYTGDPYTGCRPECVLNTDCPYDKVCSNNKCRNPCTGLCGLNADCKVSNHVPTCYCIPGYTGNALQSCHPIPKRKHLCKTISGKTLQEQQSITVFYLIESVLLPTCYCVISS